MARTNIDIDEALVTEVMALTGSKSKREAVDVSLREMVRLAQLRAAIDRLDGVRGKIEFYEGYEDAVKKDRWTSS